MIRSEILEQEFKRRYNRGVVVEKEEKPSHENKSTIVIKYRNIVFSVIEARNEGLTDFVIVTHEGREHKFKTYLEAEVYVADKIGEK